jgi:hypothetical protein
MVSPGAASNSTLVENSVLFAFTTWWPGGSSRVNVVPYFSTLSDFSPSIQR